MPFVKFDFAPVSITFDDANKSQYEKFFPIMREHGISATFYVPVDSLDRQLRMSWSNLKEIYAARNEIGSHSCAHPHLPKLSETELDRELKRSRDMLASFECKTLAYPYGEYNDKVIDCAKRYYVAARGYYDPSKLSRDYGYDHGVADEIYRLKVFPTEEVTPSKGSPLLAQSTSAFQKSIREVISRAVTTRAWTILVFHGTEMLFDLLRANSKSHFLTRLAAPLIEQRLMLKFRWLCRYLENNKDIHVMTVSEVIQQMY